MMVTESAAEQASKCLEDDVLFLVDSRVAEHARPLNFGDASADLPSRVIERDVAGRPIKIFGKRLVMFRLDESSAAQASLQVADMRTAVLSVGNLNGEGVHKVVLD